MESDIVGTGICKSLDILLRLGDHEVRIELHVRIFPDRLDNRDAEGDIIDVVTVHNIDMKVLGMAFHLLDISHQIAEIGCKYRRCYINVTHCFLLCL